VAIKIFAREAMSRRGFWQVALLIATVVGTLVLMCRSAVRDPRPTGLPNDLRYLHNFPGDFRRNAIQLLIEAVIALLLIRPWSYQRSSGRILVAAALFAPWVLLNLMFIIHSGGIMVLHTVWLLALWLSLVCAALWAGAATIVRRFKRSGERAP
jgi:hypothetical protein